jgi:Kdo2-lipid IVA lauroyltransferase/acyltransferase
MQAISFYIGWSLMWLLSLLPFKILYIISDGLYYLIFYVFKYRRNVVYTNLKNAFPEKDEKERHKIAKKFYHHFCDLLVETIKLMTISKKEGLRRFRWVNVEMLEKYYNEGKSVLCVTGHYGNWEVSFQIGLLTKLWPLPIYKPMTNKYFDKYMFKRRARFDAEPVPMSNIFRKLVQYKKENRPTISAFVSDQTPLRSEIQYWTTFLNQDTAMFLGLEKIAKKFNYPVLYVTIDKPKRGYYDLILKSLNDNPADSTEHELTEQHVKALEEDIIRKPELWLWSHRRWKHKKEKTEA